VSAYFRPTLKAFVKWKIQILTKKQREGVFTSKTQKIKITRSSITKPKNGENQTVFAASFCLKSGYKKSINQEFEKNKIYKFRRFLLNSVKKNATKSYYVLT